MTIVHSVVLNSMMVFSVRAWVKSVSPFDTTHFIELDVLYTKKNPILPEISWAHDQNVKQPRKMGE
jgi:hypothetical protein